MAIAIVNSVTYLVAAIPDLGVWHVLVINTGIGIGLGYAATPALTMQVVPVSGTAAIKRSQHADARAGHEPGGRGARGSFSRSRRQQSAVSPCRVTVGSNFR